MNFLQKTAFKRYVKKIEDYRLSIPTSLLFESYTSQSYVQLITYCQGYLDLVDYSNKKEVCAFTDELRKALNTIESMNYIVGRQQIIKTKLRIALNKIFNKKEASKRVGLVNFLMVDTNLTKAQLDQLETLRKCLLMYCAFVNDWDLGEVIGSPVIGKVQKELKAYYQH